MGDCTVTLDTAASHIPFTHRPLPTVALALPRNRSQHSFRFCSGPGLPVCMQIAFPCPCPSMQERTGGSL